MDAPDHDRRLVESPAAASSLEELSYFYDHLIGAGPMLMFAGQVTAETVASTDRMGFDVFYVSPNAHELLGPISDDLSTLPKLWFDRVHPDDQKRLLARRAQSGSAEQLDRVGSIYRFRADDGTFRWVETVVRFFGPFRGGEAVAVHGYAIDVSAYQDAQEELMATHRRLNEALVEAEHANRAKTDFLSRTSHELRTPLNSVLGFAELLSMDELSPLQRESVDHILGAGRHLLELINDVLDIAQIESGNLNLKIEPVSLHEVLDATLELVDPLRDPHDVSLSVVPLSQWNHVVDADRRRLVQILVNLVTNAIKYNRPGGAVTLACERDDNRVRIAVEDTGVGIAPEQVGRVFDPFDRLAAEHTDIEGTGVGLALSKGLAEEMGGTLDVRSELGAGSTFTLELPASETEDQNPT